MIRKILRNSKKINPLQRTVTIKDLIRREAVVGGRLFGPIPIGGDRKFFCLDEHSWVWYEEWTDKITGERKNLTTRYEVRPNGILKAQGDHPYHYVEAEEARHLIEAIKLYNRHVPIEVYDQGQAYPQAA